MFFFCMFCVYVFLRVVYVVYVFICVVFDCKCKSLKRLGEHITKQTAINKQHNIKENSKNNIKQHRNTGFPAHKPPRINLTNYSRRFVGWKSCCFMFVVCSMLFLELLCVVYVSLCFCVMCSPSLFKRLHLQSNNTYKHIKQNKHKHSKENNKTNNIFSSQTLSDIYFSRRFVGWKSCISVCFCCFSFLKCLFFELLCLFLCLFLFCLCFRLVFLSFCIYNRTNI